MNGQGVPQSPSTHCAVIRRTLLAFGGSRIELTREALLLRVLSPEISLRSPFSRHREWG